MIGLEQSLDGLSLFALGVLASVFASIGTGLGALPTLLITRVSQRGQDVLQSVAAGIMLAATMLSLIVPGLDAATTRYGGPLLAAGVLGLAMLAGSLGVLLVHQRAPHEHFWTGHDGPSARRLRRTWLFVIAITLHNFPEGLAVGVGFGDGDVGNGIALSAAIFLQNLPEGFIVALGMLSAGYSKRFSVFVAFATGMVETLGGVIGAATITVASASLPWAMGLAAGAMIFVISHEIIPETHRNGYETEATFGLIGGFIVMVLMNAMFI